MNTLINSLVSSVTGTDFSTISAEASAAEQYGILLAEVIIFLMVLMVIELGAMLYHQR